MGKLMGVEQLFEGRHFDRWYLRFKLSLRDLVEMMAERGLSLAHTTIMREVIILCFQFIESFVEAIIGDPDALSCAVVCSLDGFREGRLVDSFADPVDG